MNLDESIGKTEVGPREEVSVVQVFQDVLDKLSDVGKKDKLLKFFKLVQGVLLLVFVRFLGGDTGNLYRNVFL
jgi:CRISPR/Cas system CSM-associated protein Csm2 small subunit